MGAQWPIICHCKKYGGQNGEETFSLFFKNMPLQGIVFIVNILLCHKIQNFSTNIFYFLTLHLVWHIYQPCFLTSFQKFQKFQTTAWRWKLNLSSVVHSVFFFLEYIVYVVLCSSFNGICSFSTGILNGRNETNCYPFTTCSTWSLGNLQTSSTI